ncbi:putative bifunctional diguanylate cyclase/phosphodiesterase [Enterobacter cancerogenus]|uniref:putative bifunctional diguanylate cyclase/phosphodiesterase n=1 Tax=Enterobacter cancerogenus TaxID=69218 RepID=UPI0005365160|nr:EAL domain-containing protein [Enterobacter cancerogenus]KGT91734.1 diguanylate cyclase [Enterobacter cancerogenus]
MASYQQANALPENALDRLTTLAARLFRVPTAFVSLIDDQRQLFASRYGLNITGTARSVAFCDHTLAQGEILCVPDALDDPRFRDSPLVHGYPHIRFYAGIPLTTPDGHHIGTVCLTDTQPRPPLTDADRQHLTDIAALVMDRMEVHRLELLRHASQQRLESISATSPDAIICTDLRQGITFWNPAATAMFGYGPEEMAGQYVAGLIPERCQTDYRNELERLTADEAAISQPRTLQIWGLRRDGREFPADVSFSGWQEGGERLVGMIIRDVTARHESEARLCELASLDMLTRLASRGAFMQQLGQLTEAGVPYTLLMIDLDGFKEVNDTLGHAAGDALLCHVAEQIRQTCPGAVTAARLGGDEFIILLPGGSSGAGLTADRLIAAVQRPFSYHGSPVVVGASTGIAAYPEHGEDTSAVMSAADLALYRAKASGKGCSVLFRPEFLAAEQRRRRFERELETAVRQQQFILHYQPRYDAVTGRLLGCEALVRWQHPARGLLLPADFIEMLVKSPLSVTLGEWIIRTALAQVRQWQVRCPELRVSINLFPRQLSDPGLESVLRESAGGDAVFVDLEVDEPLLAELVQDAPAQFAAIRLTGAAFVIDHYGRTLGAISLLRHGFVSGFKIDKSLTLELDTNMRVRMMFRAIAELGKSLGLSVAAEGVEDVGHRAFVTGAQCDIMQGNGLCRPLTAAAFEALLAAENASMTIMDK